MKFQNSKYFFLDVWEVVFIFSIPIKIQIGIWNPDVPFSRDLFDFGMIYFYLHFYPLFVCCGISLCWGGVVTFGITSSRTGAAIELANYFLSYQAQTMHLVHSPSPSGC